MEFTNSNGKRIDLERFVWIAFYNDNTSLSQFDTDTQTYHYFREIEQSKLMVFRILDTSNNQTYDLQFDPSTMKLIHFYRTLVVKGASTTNIRITCFGYETDAGVLINVILPDGRLITTNKKDFHINFQLE